MSTQPVAMFPDKWATGATAANMCYLLHRWSSRAPTKGEIWLPPFMRKSGGY